MAVQATRITLNHPGCFDKETIALIQEGKISGGSLSLKVSESVEDSMLINKIKHSAIIISASGMFNTGRIRHHLKQNLDAQNVVLSLLAIRLREPSAEGLWIKWKK